MPNSVKNNDVQALFHQVQQRKLTPSPEDWRDHWIYFLMVDRFNNPVSDPKHLPYNEKFGGFQGGTIEGVRQKLDYLKELKDIKTLHSNSFPFLLNGIIG